MPTFELNRHDLQKLSFCLFCHNIFFLLFAATLNCTFVFGYFGYECAVKNLSVMTPTVISDVIGTHMSGKSHSDVVAIYIDNQVVRFFPKSIETFFANVRSIWFTKILLSSISVSDLSVFKKLDTLTLKSNSLESLPSDLFQGNPLIQEVDFSYNNISRVGQNIFKPIPLLKTVRFNNNFCINVDAFNLTAVQDLQNLLNVKCVWNRILH